MKIKLILTYILLTYCPLHAQKAALEIDSCCLALPRELVPFAEFLEDKDFKINDLSVQSFEPLDSLKLKKLEPNTTYWFRFSIENTSSNTFQSFLFTNKQSITELYDPNGRVVKGGNHTIVSELAQSNERDILPISVPPLTHKMYFLRLKTLKKQPIFASLQLINEDNRAQWKKQWQLENKGQIVFHGITILILLIIAVFSCVQGRLVRDKTYFFYAAYLLLLGLYYLRNFERNTDIPLFILKYPVLYDLFEVYLNVLSYIFYLLFFQQFLNMAVRSPKIDRILRGTFWAIVAALFVNILCQIFGGIRLGLWFFDRVRMGFFGFVLFYFYVIIALKGDKRTRLLGFGLLAVVLPAIVSVFENLTGSVLTEMYAGTWRHYQLSNWHYGFYDIRVGVLIEICCFSLALYYKTKKERQQNFENNQRLISLNAEHEALKQQAEAERRKQAEEQDVLKLQLENMKKTVINGHTNTENEFILRGQKIVADNLSNEQFSVDEWARLMNSSRSIFSTKWKKETNETPSDYIRNCRFDFARTLLLTSQLNISEIAERCGFKEAAHFTNSFTKHFGMNPTEFRRLKD